MAKHNSLGIEGEQIAVAHLRKEGYEILAENYRFDKAEVDIIARTGDTLVIVEVKTRSTPNFGLPQEFVKPKQKRQLLKVADFYINDQNLSEVEARFDIIAIVINKQGVKVEHLEDAFYHFQ
ncbi:MAG TPA: YraN family protein [Salegentibacter sp.]|nr:YraN family protein [Salegentibacter sp.]